MLREGDTAGARPLLERALRIYEKGYRPRHSKTIGTRSRPPANKRQAYSKPFLIRLRK